nr:hypothetical protein [Candidatus Freyarchaeota archaeon]
MEEEEKPAEEEKVDAAATLLFLAFILTVGYILQGWWAGIYPFTINYAGEVYLTSPVALILLCIVAFLSLLGGMIRAQYHREYLAITVIVGLIVLAGLTFVLLSQAANPFQIPY